VNYVKANCDGSFKALNGAGRDENGRKNPIYTSVSIFFWWKWERVRKMRVRKRNRNMRTYGNGQIRMESRKIKLRSHNLIFSKYTYIGSCNNIYKVIFIYMLCM
jgi:hypothetical protein